MSKAALFRVDEILTVYVVLFYVCISVPTVLDTVTAIEKKK